MDIRKGLSRITRYAVVTVVCMLISYAALVVIGRQLLPHLDTYQSDINRFFSEQFNVPLSAEQTGGTWTRLTPRLWVEGLRIGATDVDEASVLRVDRATAELDLPRSLLAASPVWRNLTLGNIQLGLSEDADGHWSVDGLSRSADGNGKPGNLGHLINNLLVSRFVGIQQVSATLRFYSGILVTINLNDIKFESDGDFRRLTAGLALDEDPESAHLVIEGRADATELSAFDGQGYLRLERINFSGSLRALVAGWFPQLVDRMGEIESELAAEFWLTVADGGGIELEGRLGADEIPFGLGADLPPMKNLSAELTGWLTPGRDWGLRWQNLDFDWADVDIKPVNLLFSQKMGANWGEISLAASQLNLATLNSMLLDAELVAGKTREVLTALQPAGHLQNLHIELDLNEDFPVKAVRTRIDRLAVKSWARAPAARGLSGHLEWQGGAGFFDLDSPDGFAMHYPGVYKDYMVHGSSRGRVNIKWLEGSAGLQIAGGPIDINGEEGQIRAYLLLDIPTQDTGEVPEMWLTAGIRNSHSRYSRQYIPDTLNPALLGWLERAVGAMDIVEGGFIWRGPLVGKDFLKRSIQVYARVEQGQVNFDPGWPKLRDMSAYITVDGDVLNGVISTARLGDAEVKEAVVKTVPSKAGMLLQVNADVATPLAGAADILLGSPIKERVSVLHDWQLNGQAQVALDLAIPLSQGASGAHYRVNANVTNGRMTHRTAGLQFTDMRGQIGYSDEKGLYSSGVLSKFWGQDIKATIATAAGETRIMSIGEFKVSTLPQWQPQLMQRVTGASDYHAAFVMPALGSEPHLLFRSSMNGVELDFPAPLSKGLEQDLPFEAQITFADSLRITARLGDELAGSFLLKAGELVHGEIALDGQLPDLPEVPGLSIVGYTPSFDLNEWLAIYASSTTQGDFRLAQLVPRFAVHIGELRYRDQVLGNVGATGLYDSEGLDFYLDSDRLAGQVKIPAESGRPVFVRLNYLALPKPDLKSGQSLLDQIDPSRLPYVDFATEGLRIGNNEFGNVGFLMRPVPQGVELTNIDAEITGIEISQLPDGEPAVLRWMNIDGQHRSDFSGVLKTHDLGAVLKAWRLPVVLKSEQAASIVELSSQDKPWASTMTKLTGHAALNFKDGNFYQAPGTTTNAFIKLISLINFDSWLRRLQLDFSDLFTSGVNYSSLKGGLRFAEGTMDFDAPIVVEMPSGKMRLLGRADLVTETIDAQLVATLPVGTNLPWMAALVGGLPAAAGVYLTGKLFEKEVNRISSLGYRISGPWSDPEVEVDRIFSDKTETKVNAKPKAKGKKSDDGNK